MGRKCVSSSGKFQRLYHGCERGSSAAEFLFCGELVEMNVNAFSIQKEVAQVLRPEPAEEKILDVCGPQ